jgi:hypothetical protein
MTSQVLGARHDTAAQGFTGAGREAARLWLRGDVSSEVALSEARGSGLELSVGASAPPSADEQPVASASTQAIKLAPIADFMSVLPCCERESSLEAR